MTISGILPLRNGVKLNYPFEIAIRSLQLVCDEVVVLVDPTSEDDSVARVRALSPDVLVESTWDTSNHNGKMHGEVAIQTATALAHASGDWVISLQADEVLHEKEVDVVRAGITWAETLGITALELVRLYFFGSLTQYRDNWTVPLPRLFKRGCWEPDPRSGAMYFVPVIGERRPMPRIDAKIYHYSRVGDPQAIARRVRNLDLLYHLPNRVASEANTPPYTFELRKLDTYVIDHQAEADETARLLSFPLDGHPAGVLEYFHAG